MLSTWVFFGFVAAFTVPVFCCRPKEYLTSNGQCCPMCHEGTVVRRDCTEQSGTSCSPCEPGTFMDTPNGLKACRSCSSCNQDHGLFIKEECTKTRDTVCEVLSGYFCKSLEDDKGCSLAEKHRRCEPGQRIKEPGTSRTDTVCEPCQPGTFSQDGVNCRAWTICSETQVKVKEGTTSSDVVCEIASRHHYFLIAVSLLVFVIVGILITVFLLWHKKRSFLEASIEKQRTQSLDSVVSLQAQGTLLNTTSPAFPLNPDCSTALSSTAARQEGRPMIDPT